MSKIIYLLNGNNDLSQRFKIKFFTSTNILLIIIFITGVASAPLQFAGNREVVSLAGEITGDQLTYSENFTLLSRLFNIILGLLLIFLVTKLYHQKIEVPSAIRKVIIASAIFLFFNYIVGSAFGTNFGLPKNLYLIFCPLVIMLLLLVKNITPDQLLRTFRFTGVIMLGGSIALGILFPDIAYAQDYFAFSFSDSKRLIGLFSHPSQIGIFALLLLAIELRTGSLGWRNIVMIIICWSALVMSVSKTAIALAIILLIIHLVSKSKGYVLAALFIIVSIYALFKINAHTPTLFNDTSNLSTLTGRTYIWSMVISKWSTNPLFGNGPSFFSGSGKTVFSHAHNIFLQYISDGGAFGLIGFIAYLTSLFSLALKNAKRSSFLSIILVLLILLFSMSEPVMRVNSFIDGSFFVNAFVVLYLCALERQRVIKLNTINISYRRSYY